MNRIFISFVFLVVFCIVVSCRTKNLKENPYLNAHKMMYAMERVDKYYVKKNPLMKEFLKKSKLNKNEISTYDIKQILQQSDSLIMKIEISKSEIENIEELRNTDLKTSSIDFLDHLKEFELLTQQILKKLTNNNHNKEGIKKETYNKTIAEYSIKHSKYQNALSAYFSKYGITQKEVDSMVSLIKSK